MILPCYFCQRQLESNGFAISTHVVACDGCPEICSTTYNKIGDEFIFYSARIILVYRDREYHAMYFPNHFGLYLTQETRDGTLDYDLVMRLPFIPDNITPYNIKQKLPTLLVWS